MARKYKCHLGGSVGAHLSRSTKVCSPVSLERALIKYLCLFDVGPKHMSVLGGTVFNLQTQILRLEQTLTASKRSTPAWS